MLTECPSCLTVFRVTGAILKMGHGQVRCGKCRTQFDALDSLLDDEDAPGEAAKAVAESKLPAEPPGIEAQESDLAEEITMEGSRIEISGTYRVPVNEAAAKSDRGSSQIVREHMVIDRDPARSNYSADDSGDNDAGDADQPARPAMADESDDENYIEINADDGEPVAEAAHHLLADSTPTDDEPEAEPLPLSQRMWKRARQQREASHAAAHQIDAELDALTQPPPQPRDERARWWTAASIVLVLALIVQAVHHYRDPLVRNPKWGGTVSRVYRALGLTLTPHWDLHAYELQQWGVISDGAAHDALRVRASVTNTATFAQPYPLIKLVLDDRWGAPVATREFAPEEYLPSASANRMMAPRQRTNAEIVIVDPGADAVGFQVHACLLQSQGMVCSDDVAVAK
jgi:predicted Zn finger-like uncharacterized protein